MIGAGGMVIELIIASTATFLWWNSHEGLFNQMCLNVMFVSSVSTLLFNANPLMRFDGYYILSDMLRSQTCGLNQAQVSVGLQRNGVSG